MTLHETASFDLADFPVPTGREEQWRFTPLSRLKGLHDGSAVNDGNDRTEVLTPAGVTYELVSRDDSRIGAAGKPADRVAAQAYNGFEKAGVITVPKELVPAEPIVVNVHGQGGTVFRHLLVDVKPLAEAVVVINYTGTGAQAANVEFVVGDGAEAHRGVEPGLGPRRRPGRAVHRARLGSDATFKSIIVTLGGDLVRISPRVSYTAPGGRGRAGRALLRRRRAAPRTPAAGRPQRAQLLLRRRSTRAASRARTPTRCGSAT